MSDKNKWLLVLAFIPAIIALGLFLTSEGFLFSNLYDGKRIPCAEKIEDGDVYKLRKCGDYEDFDTFSNYETNFRSYSQFSREWGSKFHKKYITSKLDIDEDKLAANCQDYYMAYTVCTNDPIVKNKILNNIDYSRSDDWCSSYKPNDDDCWKKGYDYYIIFGGGGISQEIDPSIVNWIKDKGKCTTSFTYEDNDDNRWVETSEHNIEFGDAYLGCYYKPPNDARLIKGGHVSWTIDLSERPKPKVTITDMLVDIFYQ